MSPRAKTNRGKMALDLDVDPSLELDEDTLSTGTTRFERWHWGNKPTRVIDWSDPDMPEALVECGRLIQLHVRPVRGQQNPGHPRRERDSMIEFSKSASSGSFIAFDPDHPSERLYLLLPPQICAVMKVQFWDQNHIQAKPLNDLAFLAGGRHGTRRDYPEVDGKPLGLLTAVAYFTDKRGDGPSYYIHKFGEESGILPIPCVDVKGRLWFAGGNYRTLDPGITD